MERPAPSPDCGSVIEELDPMRTILAGVVVTASVLAFASAADAKGCIKGAIVGGVAGHMAGHGKMGAAAGCAVGHHHANKKSK